MTAGSIAAGGVIDAREVDDALSLVGGGGRVASDGVREVLSRYDGNLSAAARSLGVARSTLRNRLHREQPEVRRRRE